MILDPGEAFYSNLGTVEGTGMGAVFFGCWNPSDLFWDHWEGAWNASGARL